MRLLKFRAALESVTPASRALRRVVLLIAFAAATLPAADNTLTAQEKAAGWKLIFDGRTFAGWDDPTKKSPPGDSFTISDGCIKVTANPKISEDLFSKANYRDFELEFDWKISPGGNSGVKYRIQDHVFVVSQPGMRFEDQVNASLKNRPTARPASGADYVIGFEYQLLDDERHPDAKAGTTHQTGALYDVFPPSAKAARPVGEFNHSRLVVKGNHVEHWLNAVKVVDASLDAPEIAAAAERRWGKGTPVGEMLARHPNQDCPISLQNHNDEAWFKNIKIRELSR
jgi:hypothetical protein